MTHGVSLYNSDLEEDYLAITAGVALLDLSQAGKLEISGDNAAQFLNGLVSNDVKSLSAGNGTVAAFLTIQGKVLAIARVYRRETSFLLEIEESNREKILRNLSRFVPAGGFHVADLTTRLGVVSIQGPFAEELISLAIGRTPAGEPFSNIDCEVASSVSFLTRNSRAGCPGFDLFVPAGDYETVRDYLLKAGASLGARLIGRQAFEAARIDAGIPREPEDVNESRILLEAGFEQAVSYTKGCYLGQEIIARIHWRGQPARQLKRLIIAADQPPSNGAELYADDEKKVGEITSSALIPQVGDAEPRIVALGYVHRHYLTPGMRFSLREDGAKIGEAEIRGV